jgi:hypothetical protein
MGPVVSIGGMLGRKRRALLDPDQKTGKSAMKQAMAERITRRRLMHLLSRGPFFEILLDNYQTTEREVRR